MHSAAGATERWDVLHLSTDWKPLPGVAGEDRECDRFSRSPGPRNFPVLGRAERTEPARSDRADPALAGRVAGLAEFPVIRRCSTIGSWRCDDAAAFAKG